MEGGECSFMRIETEKIITAVGGNIYKLRKQHGLSQTALALELESDPSVVSKYERGTREMGIGVLYRIASYFDVPVDTLFQTDDCHSNSDDASRLFESLNREGQETALRILKTLAETPSLVKAKNRKKTP
jgi:transcriptional regulator with XRE-family HTH domain